MTSKLSALLVCERSVIERDTNKISLIGIFNQINANNLPATVQLFFVFMRLDSAKASGSLPLVLTIESPAEKEILRMDGEVKSDGQRLDIPLQIPALSFPDWGKYKIRLSVNGAEVGTTDLELKKL